MQKRQSVEDRKIAAARRLRTLQGAKYGDSIKSFVELAVNEPQFVIIRTAKPEHSYVQELNLESSIDVRILDADGLVTIGNGRFADGEGTRHETLPISYDGSGMFWWLKASPVADVATAIREDALYLVDQALARKTWNDQEEAEVEARGVLSIVSKQYAVLPDNSVLTGSAVPGMRLVDNGQWLFLEMFDKHVSRLAANNSLDLATGPKLALAFGILEYAAAEEFLILTAERNPDRRVAHEALVERRDLNWVKDFTHNRDRWADGGFFSEYVSALCKHIAHLRPKGDRALDAAVGDLQFRTSIWMHDHDATNAKLDEILNLRDLLLRNEPKFDDLLADRLKWPYNVKPLEVLEIRARGLKELIAAPAFSPSI